LPEAEPQTNINETIGGIFRLIARRRWWIILPACVISLATIAVLSRLPNRYNSEATLLVVQQQVPERYVVPTNSSGIAEELQAMTQEVLSRTRLLEIIDEFHLYQKETRRLAPEEVIDLMRKNIDIKPINEEPARKDFNAFKISFTSDNPRLAQAVTSKLTTLFIAENLKTREDQAANTTSFLQAQLETVRTKLTEQEQRLREFKMQHLGELPEQQAGNLAILTGLQSQLQNTMAGLSRAQQQKVYLESLLSGYRSLAARGSSLPGVPGIANRAASPLDNAQKELERLEANRDLLLGRYTPEHPDVVEIESEIRKQQATVERLKSSLAAKAETPAENSKGAPAALPNSEDDASIAQVKSQLEANRLEMENLSSDEKRLKGTISDYQNRLNATPVREQELAEVSRNYELLKSNYADLLSKEQQSQLATSLEKQQGGQQFRLVDPPSLPTLPSSPKRLKMSLGGIGAGIALGLALAFLVDLTDRSFHTEKDLTKSFALPLVLCVPLIRTSREERGLAVRRMFEWALGCVLAIAVFAAEFYVYRFG
jgi:polysaccharide chain length determinant protein (PEP-CTERM system associated)